MTIRMQKLEGMTLEEMREFVESNRKLRFEAEDRPALYGLVERVLKCGFRLRRTMFPKEAEQRSWFKPNTNGA